MTRILRILADEGREPGSLVKRGPPQSLISHPVPAGEFAPMSHSASTDRIDALKVGIALGYLVSVPVLAALPLVIVSCYLLLGGGGLYRETAYFIVFWYSMG